MSVMPANVDYSAALAKLHRAQTHIRDADFEIFRWLRRHPYQIRKELNFNTGKHGFYISLTEPIPRKTSLIVGDAVHCLRSALDHIISACAIAQGRSPNDTAFPIVTDRDQFEKRVKDKARKAGALAVEQVRYLKPYPGGDGRLVGLHQLDMIDKHRTLLVVAGAGDFRTRYLPRANHPQFEVEDSIYLLGDTEQFVPAPEGRESDTPFEIGLSVEVVFGADGPMEGQPCVRSLNAMSDAVADAIALFQERCP